MGITTIKKSKQTNVRTSSQFQVMKYADTQHQMLELGFNCSTCGSEWQDHVRTMPL